MGGTSTPGRSELTKTPTASIVVAVWNRADITARFLAQLKPHLEEIHDLVIVDDCSTDRTPSVLKWWEGRLGTKIRILRNRQRNRGYGPSYNRGIGEATGNIIVVMNNDIEIRGSFITPTIHKLIEEPRSLVTASLVDWDGGWNKWNGRIIPYAEGWYLAAWKEIWDELKWDERGVFDEQFVPCDYEDQDLSYRAVQAGIQLTQLKFPIRHIGGVSTSQLSRKKITFRNRRLFAEKWGFELDHKA